MKKAIILLSFFIAVTMILSGCKKDTPSSSSTAQSNTTTPASSDTQSEVVSSKSVASSSIQSIPYVANVEGALLGKWIKEAPEGYPDLYTSIYEFIEDGTVIDTFYKPADEDYPENHNVRTGTYRLYTYRDRENAIELPLRSKEVIYWEVSVDENGTEYLRLWRENPDGTVKFGTEDIYTRIPA